MKKTKVSKLQVYLIVLYVTSLLVSNVIAGKQLQLPFGITMTGAVIVFPITYILSDLFSEVYGYGWSRTTCYLAFAMNLIMVAVFGLVIVTPAPSYWENQEAFATVLGNTPRMLFASLAGFVLGDFANDIVFKKMKQKSSTEFKGFKLRAILSSLVGELIDSAIFIPIAFVGQMPFATMVIMGITQVSLKIAYEIIIVPLTAYCCKKAAVYEKENE